MKPTKRLHPNPDWKYVPSGQTNLAATFKRVVREQAEAAKKLEDERLAKIARTVTPFRSGR